MFDRLIDDLKARGWQYFEGENPTEWVYLLHANPDFYAFEPYSAVVIFYVNDSVFLGSVDDFLTVDKIKPMDMGFAFNREAARLVADVLDKIQEG